MEKKTIFGTLALVLITLSASAQSLTAFKDSFGDHIYYQGSAGFDLNQLWPTGGMNIDMTQLPVSSNTGNPGPFAKGGGGYSHLASAVNARGQHVYYFDNSGEVRHLLVYWNGSENIITNDNLTAMTGVSYPWAQSGAPLSAFANARGEHLYLTGSNGHVLHLFWNGSQEVSEDLFTLSRSVSPACAYLPSGSGAPTSLASDADGSTELVYYIGPSGHVCELAWYSGAEGSYDLTAMSGATPAGDAGLITAFADANGQHVFYLGTNRHLYMLNLSHTGLLNIPVWTKADLTAEFGGNPPTSSTLFGGNSLSSFSNGSGEQVYFVDINQHVNRINLTQRTHQDLTASFGGVLAAQYSWCGTPLTILSTDDKGSEDVFYVGADQHVWELHDWGNGTWSTYDLTSIEHGVAVQQCVSPIG